MWPLWLKILMMSPLSPLVRYNCVKVRGFISSPAHLFSPSPCFTKGSGWTHTESSSVACCCVLILLETADVACCSLWETCATFVLTAAQYCYVALCKDTTNTLQWILFSWFRSRPCQHAVTIVSSTAHNCFILYSSVPNKQRKKESNFQMNQRNFLFAFIKIDSTVWDSCFFLKIYTSRFRCDCFVGRWSLLHCALTKQVSIWSVSSWLKEVNSWWTIQ